jgi:hypothetical protein
MTDAMADYQQEYDQAVAQHGADSPEALAAEQAAHQFLKGTRAPVTPVFQQEH